MAIMKKLLILLLFIPYLGFSQIKISALTEATTLNANDWFMAVQGGTTKKVAFYRFSYNQDSTALQITDSLAFYVQKTELSDSLLNYILRTELNDSLANYTSLDSLTYYMKTIDVRNAISDSIAGISSVSLGTANQVPFMNVAGSDFIYKDSLEFTGDSMLFPEVVFKVGSNYEWNKYVFSLNSEVGRNTLIGEGVKYAAASVDNVVLGYNAFFSALAATNNVVLGNKAGYSIGNDSYNVYIGSSSGYNATGSSNIFIGRNSGYNETGSNKLYIENSNSATPLIWGDFANDTVRINGTLDVTGNITSNLIAAKSAFSDSTITITGGTNVQVTNATDSLFRVTYNDGFTWNGDTAILTMSGSYRIDFAVFGGGSNGTDWEIKRANKRGSTVTYGDASAFYSTSGSANYEGCSLNAFIIDGLAGDRVWLVLTRKAGTGDFTLRAGIFQIYKL